MNMPQTKKNKNPPKRLARRRKKNGIQGLLEAIIEFAMAGLKIYRRAEPIIKKKKRRIKKPIKINGNGVKP